MTFSYSGDPADSDLDEVRFLLGDTATPSLLTDEEIEYLIAKLETTYSDMTAVASYGAEAIATRYAGEVTISADGVSYSGEQLQDKYCKLASDLRAQYERLQARGAEAYAGGTNVWDLWPRDVVPLNFGIGMHDNIRAGNQRYGYLGDLYVLDELSDIDPVNIESP